CCLAPIPGKLIAWPDPPRRDCNGGYRIIEEVHYQDVVKKVCKVVPEVKKVEKWVYDYKTVDFCVPKCSLHGTLENSCSSCQPSMQCDRPMSKNVLIKRKVVEEVKTQKCVVETVVERVPYTIRRKVPCDEVRERIGAPSGTPIRSSK
ncbi:MAG: hypothetical protein NZM29_07280, partial [Nitrospira sp.]|nr:hypothetical protein [Nitrospira sp.]